MEIKNILSFKKENIFDGAVQIDWFYDKKLRGEVASSYIFHGPKYFGLSSNDIKNNKHKLIDTASFIKNISDKIYLDDSTSRFVLTIAGYGAGKSHLGVTISSLFSGSDKQTSENILENIKTVDEDIHNNLKHTATKPNLIITLNGMNNFNLNNEILKNAQKALKLHGQDTLILEEISTSYITAENFLNNIYNSMKKRFIFYASKSKKYKLYSENDLKDKLLEDIREDQEAFEIVDNVYNEVIGNHIRWDDGISASNILSKLNEHFCIKHKVFNKIIILFDEFGRFLEYASAFPNQAGDSALQQIFEAIQNANKNILFIGFIQSDLSAYLSRVDNPNIVRYVGRYDASDKYYLSSNLETVLANLIVKDDKTGVLEGFIERRYKNYHNNLHTSLNRWVKDMNQKSVWSNSNLYNKVVLRGCYPFHPLTVWMLSNLSTWMQQRSTLNFASDIFDKYKNYEVYDEGLTYIYPTEIIKSNIFNELLNAEEKGLQQSQYCILYNEVLIKYGDKLEDDQKDILQGILVSNICKFKVYDKNDYITLLKYCTGYGEEYIQEILRVLEDDLGIIRFDADSKTYDFIAEGNGKNDFINEFKRKRNQVSKEGYLDVIDEKIKKELDMDIQIETPFGMENSIVSGEWKFNKRITHIDNITSYSINNLIREQNEITDITEPKGMFIYVYANKDSYIRVNELQRLIIEKEVYKYPILFMLVNDSDDTIKNRLIDIRVLREIEATKRDKYSKFINEYRMEFIKRVVSKFKQLEQEKSFVTENGIERKSRIVQLCNNTFLEKYTKVTPFPFDGFDKSTIAKPTGYLVAICKGLLNNTITKKEGFLNLAKDEQNRAKAVLMIDSMKSWKVMASDYTLLEPQHPVLSEMYREVMDNLGVNNLKTIDSLFRKYLYPPYNMNLQSLVLFISYLIGYNSKNISVYDKDKKIKIGDFIQSYIEKKTLDAKKIFSCSLEYKEGSKEEKFVQLVDQINNNVYVEKCSDYEFLLNKLEQEDEVPEELNTKIAIAKMRLEKGKQIKVSIYSVLSDAKQVVDNCKNNKFSLSKLAKSYKNMNISENDKLEMEYQYSYEYINECKRLLVEIDTIIEDNINRFLASINSKSPEKFYKQSVLHNQEVKLLNIIGKKDIANKLEKRLSVVEKEIQLTQKYEEQLIKYKSDCIIIQESLSNKNYKKLERSLDLINYWIKFFNSNTDLTADLRNESIEKLNSLKIKVGQTLDSIEGEIRAVELDERLLDDIDSIRTLKRSIRVLLDKVRDSKFDDKFNKKLDLLEDIESDFSYLESNANNREFVTQKLDQLYVKYSNTTLNKLIDKKKDSIINNLDQMESRFIDGILININSKINSLNYKECIENINKLSNRPPYIGEKAKDMSNIVIKKLYDRLNKNKVETIVSMFNELDSSSKANCIELIKNLL